jgi:hypothetical protein
LSISSSRMSRRFRQRKHYSIWPAWRAELLHSHLAPYAHKKEQIKQQEKHYGVGVENEYITQLQCRPRISPSI